MSGGRLSVCKYASACGSACLFVGETSDRHSCQLPGSHLMDLQEQLAAKEAQAEAERKLREQAEQKFLEEVRACACAYVRVRVRVF